jgi:hypothetical protein
MSAPVRQTSSDVLAPGTVCNLTRALESFPRGEQVIILRLLTRIEWMTGEQDALFAIEIRGKRFTAYLSDLEPTGNFWREAWHSQQKTSK